MGQKDYKSGQRLQNKEKRLQIGAGITNRDRDYKLVQNNAHINDLILGGVV